MSRILIIEDDLDLRESIQDLLLSEGFDIVAPQSSLEGVELARQWHPDIILCDIMMPQLDGYGVLERLRQDAVTASIPLIFLTAKSAHCDMRLAMNLGANDYLIKPFEPAELIEAIGLRLDEAVRSKQRYDEHVRQLEEGLAHAVHYDSVTQLPNRLLMSSKLQHLQATLARTSMNVAVLAVGIDRFGWIDSTLGTVLSNQLQKRVAGRLIDAVDYLSVSVETISQLDRGRFGVIVVSPEIEREALMVARTISESLSYPCESDDSIHAVTVSIGVDLSPPSGVDMAAATARAELAMHKMHRQGGNGFRVYSPELQDELVTQVAIDSNLQAAIDRDEFVVYFQPLVDLVSGQIAGAEALVRWQHPEWGLLSPGQFIHFAEETSAIHRLGRWVLKTACAQASKWENRFRRALRLSVNLSARQFNNGDFSVTVRDVLASTGLPASLLDLELTERTFLEQSADRDRVFRTLKQMGIHLSLDDFGMGYSSFSCLQAYPFDTLKIDRCFVRDLDTDPSNAAISKSIVGLAHDLGLTVVGEGVETQAELNYLSHHRCDRMQGYLFSPPVPADRFEQLLTEDRRLAVSVASC